MYLSRLVIKNFRSINEADLTFGKGKNVIVGRNNAGKSNILKAIDVLLGESSPTYAKSDNVTELDFHSFRNEAIVESATELTIACILKREKEEELNFAAINEATGFYKVLSAKPDYKLGPNGDIEKRFHFDTYTTNEFDSIFILDKDVDDPTAVGYIVGKRWVDGKLSNVVKFEDELNNKFEFMYVFRAKIINHRVEKYMRFLYRETSEKDWILALNSSIRGELLQSAVISSFRDPVNQLRATSYTWYGKLLKHITQDHPYSEELETAYSQVKSVTDKIFTVAREKIQTSTINVAFPGADISFQLNEDKSTETYKDSKIYIDDGVKSPLSDKGAGIQSATIIGLFSYYVRQYNSKASALLCVEEPELYLHPHARRVISDRFDEFLENGKNQVIMTTHSPEFIKTTGTELNIILVKRINKKTVITPIEIREFQPLLLDDNHNEIFFADKVILCEGLDSHIIKWIADEKFPMQLNANNTTILNCGGKNNIHKYAELVRMLGLECYLVADFDYYLRDKDIDKCAKYGSKPSESIQSLGLKFFAQSCTFDSEGEEVFKKIQRTRSQLKASYEKEFYLASNIDELPKVKENAVIFFKTLRKHGICILDGEVEDLSLDSTLVSPKSRKLSNDSIYEISEIVNKNKMKNISEIFQTDEIESFLNAVFNEESKTT